MLKCNIKPINLLISKEQPQWESKTETIRIGVELLEFSQKERDSRRQDQHRQHIDTDVDGMRWVNKNHEISCGIDSNYQEIE